MTFFKKKRNIFLSILLIIMSFYLYKNYIRLVDKNPLIDRKSIQYVNDLYMSDGKIYNNFLNDKEKKVYMMLFENVKNMKKDFFIEIDNTLCSIDGECFGLLHKAHNAILLDHPELLMYSSYSALSKNNIIEVNIEYAVPFKTLAYFSTFRIERIIDEIKKDTKNMSDKEKIRYVYEWIGKNNKYDKVFTFMSKNQSIYNVFLNHNAVCAGFAKASQVIFQNIGINSYIVVGETTGPHMWNMVELDNKYYYFDSTVAVSFKDYRDKFYSGLDQSFLSANKNSNPEYYPELAKDEGLIN